MNVENFRALIKDGKIFSVEFIKKDGSTRLMNARFGVKKHLRGGELAYDASSKNLIPVFDLTKKEYRMINVSTIKKFKKGKVLMQQTPKKLLFSSRIFDGVPLYYIIFICCIKSSLCTNEVSFINSATYDKHGL